mgnify:CR=1 FL=1
MATYIKKFQKPYTNGYKDRPDTNTPVTAEIKNMETDALLAIEEYLANNAISSVSANIGNSMGVYIATIRINDVDYRIYTPMVRYTSEISEGTKVGTLTFGTYSFDVYAPAASAGGSSVSIMPKTTEGTNIAEITVDGTTYQLYAPTGGGGSGSTVTAEATLTEGTQIGKITIDGTEIILYAPTASEIAVDTELSATSENPVQNKIVNEALENKMDKSLETLIKYERGKTGTLTFTTTEEMTELIASYASIMNNNFALAFNLIKDCAQTQNYLSTSSIDCDLFTDYKAIYFVNGSSETNNLPNGFGGGILLNSMAGSTSAANYQYAIDFTNGKQFFRKYYHGIWTGWGETTSSGGSVTIDSELSETSTNPVENKVITTEFKKYLDKIGENDISGIGDGTITGGLNAVNEKNQQILSKSMKITTTAQGISAIEISNPDVVVSAICTDTEAHIVLPFRVGNNWFVKVLAWYAFTAVTSKDVNIIIYYTSKRNDDTETKTSENVTYGGTGVGGLATYHDLQAAPVQTAE